MKLNQRFAVETSELDAPRLRSMLAASFVALTLERREAVLIAFDQDSPYDSPNFLWFKTRYARFVYIDRIIVAPALQGRGLARAFYRRVADRAIEAGHSLLACEVNVDPPNVASVSFHASLGFVEVDRARVAPTKTVARLVRSLRELSPASRAPRP